MYIYIPKYKLVILNDVIFMYVLKIDDLVLDKHLVIFPWGRLFLPLSALFSCLQFFFVFFFLTGFIPGGLSPFTLACLLQFSLISTYLDMCSSQPTDRRVEQRQTKPFCHLLAAEIQYYCTWLEFIQSTMHVCTIETARPSVSKCEGSVFRELAQELL